MKKFIVSVVLALALILPAQSEAVVMIAKLKTVSGSTCTSGCRLYFRNRQTNVISSVAVGSTQTAQGSIFYSYPNGNQFVLISSGPSYNAWADHSYSNSWDIWETQPCVGGGGNYISTTRQMGPVTDGYPWNTYWWWIGNIQPNSGCRTVLLGAGD